MSKKKSNQPEIYVDTNIILDVVEGRNDRSTYVMEKIRDKKWECVSSTFTLMEISDIIKDEIFLKNKLQKHWSINKILRERYSKDLNQNDFEDVKRTIVNKVLQTYRFVKYVKLTPEGWQTALSLNLYSNISAPDILPLATAWDGECDILLTSDQSFLKDAKKVIEDFKIDIPNLDKLRICTPDKFDKVLKELRFE